MTNDDPQQTSKQQLKNNVCKIRVTIHVLFFNIYQEDGKRLKICSFSKSLVGLKNFIWLKFQLKQKQIGKTDRAIRDYEQD
jgi:hypothetical protein